jgi:hypothetical protein
VLELTFARSPESDTMASNDVSQDELSRLKAELALVAQSRDDFKAQLMNLAPPPSTPPCYFLEMIPIEIRNQIYGELLLNPILGTVESVKGGDPDSVEYHLSPAILSTCRQVHQEASDILYGRNTFFVVCMKNFYYDRPPVQPADLSPLTRRWPKQMFKSGFLNFEKFSNFEKVQHWRIVLSRATVQQGFKSFGSPRTTRLWSMKSFCEGLRHAAPKSLEMLVIPESLHTGWKESDSDWDFEDVLEPLQLLRNIGSLTLKSAGPEDVKSLLHFKKDKSEYQLTERDLPDLSFETHLRHLITGNSPVELLTDMYGCLLNYARSFERYEPFKFEMGLGKNEDLETQMGKHYSKHAALTKLHTNPYRGSQYDEELHPVEAALYEARNFVDSWSAEHFKSSRSRILTYLEPQYQQIVRACDNLTCFVKWEKRKDGLLEANPEQPRCSCYGSHNTHEFDLAVAMDLLEDYARAFSRQLDFPTKARFRLCKDKLDSSFNRLPRERALDQLNAMFKLGGFEDFTAVFKMVCNDLDKQYLEIRKARRELFQWDISDDVEVEIDIDLQLSRCDEMANWDVNEPDLTPTLDPSAPRSYNSGPDWS